MHPNIFSAPSHLYDVSRALAFIRTGETIMLTKTKMALAAALLVTSAVGANAASVNLSDPETAQFYINQHQAQQQVNQQRYQARSAALNARAEVAPYAAGTDGRSVFGDHAKGLVW